MGPGDMLSARLETILRGILGIPLRILSGSSQDPLMDPPLPVRPLPRRSENDYFTLVVQLWPS
jgi:hypothetical protein